MNSPVIVILGETSITIARQIQTVLPETMVYGLASRTPSADLTYDSFGDTVRELFQARTPIIGVCAAGILIRIIAPLLTNKWQEPPVLAIAEDGSTVEPLLGRLQGVNHLARQIAAVLQCFSCHYNNGRSAISNCVVITTFGILLINPDDAKTFISNLLAWETVKLMGKAPWLENSRLPISLKGKLTIQVVQKNGLEKTQTPSIDCLVYEFNPESIHSPPGKLAIVGTDPGSSAWSLPK
jgi:cobalt-precorrin 5A hydrolase/precorrin-3B C17-methyltransferase